MSLPLRTSRDVEAYATLPRKTRSKTTSPSPKSSVSTPGIGGATRYLSTSSTISRNRPGSKRYRAQQFNRLLEFTRQQATPSPVKPNSSFRTTSVPEEDEYELTQSLPISVMGSKDFQQLLVDAETDERTDLTISLGSIHTTQDRFEDEPCDMEDTSCSLLASENAGVHHILGDPVSEPIIQEGQVEHNSETESVRAQPEIDSHSADNATQFAQDMIETHLPPTDLTEDSLPTAHTTVNSVPLSESENDLTAKTNPTAVHHDQEQELVKRNVSQVTHNSEETTVCNEQVLETPEPAVSSSVGVLGFVRTWTWYLTSRIRNVLLSLNARSGLVIVGVALSSYLIYSGFVGRTSNTRSSMISGSNGLSDSHL